MEHEEQAERMEEDAERMEDHSEQLGERIDDIQSDWERKEQDPAVPGARPDPNEEDDEMTETPEESDQLPEEAPAEMVEDDDPGLATRARTTARACPARRRRGPATRRTPAPRE